MNRQQRARARRDRGGHRLRIDGQPHRIDVGKHRARADHHDRERGVRGRQRRRDHFVAGPDAERSQDQGDGVGSVADAHRMRNPARRRKFRFERAHFGAEDEPAAVQRRDRWRPGPPRDPRAAPASCRECGARSCRSAGRGALVHIAVEVLAIERERAGQSVRERRRRLPAGGARELRRVGVEIPDVDRFLLRRPRRRTRRGPIRRRAGGAPSGRGARSGRRRRH